MQVLVEKIVDSSCFITLVAAFFRHHVINVIETKLKQKPQVKKEIPIPPDRFPQASTRDTLEEESKGKRSRRKRRDCGDQNFQGRSENLCEKRRLARI